MVRTRGHHVRRCIIRSIMRMKRYLASIATLSLLWALSPAQEHLEPSTQQGKKTAQTPDASEQVKDASGKWISNDHGANLNIGPNGDVHFGNPGGTPVMTLLSGWIYLCDGGWVYKIRQSDMKLVAKTMICPDAAIEQPKPPAPKRKSTSKRRR